MNDRQLRSFLEVARCGTISEAARGLYITPQALVQQINHIEEDTGVRLLERGTHGVSLTPAGEEFAAGARRVLQEMDQLYKRVKAADRDRNDEMRIARFNFSKINREIYSRFSEAHPQIQLQYDIVPEEKWIEALDRMVAGEYDLFEHTLVPEIRQKKLEFLALFSSKSCCLLQSSHPLCGRKKLVPSDLAHQTVGIHSFLCVPGLRQRLMEQAQGVKLVEAAYGMRSSFELCNGGGVFLIPATHAEDYAPLKRIPLDVDCAWNIGLVYRQNPSASVRQLLKVAKGVYADGKSAPVSR